jgi:hypothetical protein
MYRPLSTTNLAFADSTADRITFLQGGQVGIGDATPNDGTGGGGQNLLVDIEGPTGATYFCDENGLNCFTAASVAGTGIWEKSGTVIRTRAPTVYATDDFVFGAAQLADIVGTDDDNRMFFDKSKGAFRAGGVTAAEWDDANVGSFSTAVGDDTTASGYASFAAGIGTVASGSYSSVFGGSSAASGSYSFAAGGGVTAGGSNSFAVGSAARALGNYSAAFGLGTTAGTYPQVSGANSMAIFMGDQDSVDVTASNLMALLGGRVVIDPDATSAANTNVSTGVQQLELDVQGDIGAINYCDEAGNNCFTPASVATNRALSAITAATAGNSINNADYAQVWNWNLTTADKDAFTFTENTASTATGHSSILKAATLATSTATPLLVTNLGAANSFVVNDETGDADTSPFVVDATGSVGIGTATPAAKLHVMGTSPQIQIGDNTTAGGLRFFAGTGTNKTLTMAYDALDRFVLTPAVANQGFYIGPVAGASNFAYVATNINTAGPAHQGFRITVNGTSMFNLDATTGAVGVGNTAPASRFVVAAPSTEVIGAAAVITADACGTVKRLSATANRTTDTTDTFTAPTASYAGCCMDVVNVDTVDTITLDNNAKFITGPGADLAVGPGKAVRVCSDGTSWYQASTVTSAAATILAIDDLSDAFTDYAVENNLIMGRAGAAALTAGAQRNVFIGQNAGATTANSTATTDSNTAVGYAALRDLTTGSQNTAVGRNALSNTTDGVWNVAVGNQALQENTVGNGNVAIGTTALYSNIAKQESTAIGHSAMFYADDTAVGSVTYNTAVGAYALQGSATAANNTGIGNTALGHSALMNNTSGIGNIGIGYAALTNNAGGHNNIGIGYQSMQANTSGQSNIAIGEGAMMTNATRYYNTAVGVRAMMYASSSAGGEWSGNTAFGALALHGSTTAANNTGQYNTAIGYSALTAMTSGSQNTALGLQAGDSITTGSNNILLGFDIDTPANNTSNHLNIGGTIFGDLANDNVRIGGSGAVAVGPFVATAPAAEAIAGAATITANACGTIKQINSTGNQTTNTTNTFTAPTGYAGCCMDIVNVDAADTITLDTNANFLTGPGTDLALGPAKAVRVCSDGAVWYQAASVTSVASGGNIPLSGLTAAIADNTINSGNWNQVWNWQLAAGEVGLTLGENVASTGGSADQYILAAKTLATSTATPFMITNLGTANSFRVNDATGDADTTPFVIAADGRVGVGTATPSDILNIAGDLDDTGLLIESFTDASTYGGSGNVGFRRSRGSEGSETIIQNNDEIGHIYFQPYDGSAYTNGASIVAAVDGTPGVGDTPTRLDFYTTPDGASGHAHRMVIKNDGDVGIGTTTPGRKLHVASNVEDGIIIEVANTATSSNVLLDARRARGTLAAPTVVANNDEIGEYIFMGYDGNSYSHAGYFGFMVDGTPGDNDMPTRMEIQVQQDGTGAWMGDGASVPEFTIRSSGNIGMGTASPSALLHIRKQSTADTYTEALRVEGDGEPAVSILTSSANPQHNPLIYARRSGGTVAAKTAVASGDSLLELTMQGYDGTANRDAAYIHVLVDGAVTGGGAADMPGRIEFHTQPDGAGGSLEGGTPEMVIKNNGAVGIGLASPASRFVVAAPSTEVIGAAAVITADACGTVKRLSATANRTTDTTDTFTAPTASYAGCCMDVVNVDTVDTITLDNNAKFITGPGADLAVGPGKAVRVCSDGTSWYQASTVTSAAATILAIDDLSDAFTDYAVENNLIMGRAGAAALTAGAQRNLFIGQNAGATTVNSTATTDSNTAVGYASLSNLAGGDQNTALGRNTLTNTSSGSYNTAMGNQALQQTTSGDGNTAIGSVALLSNVAKQESTAIGYGAMFYADDTAVSSVTYNTAVGAYALQGSVTAADNTGTANTAIGHSALLGNTSGTNNTALGRNALAGNTQGYSNTAIGSATLVNNDLGQSNVAIGYGVLATNTGSHASTGVGAGALGIATGGRNTALGAAAGDSITTGTDNIVIGFDVDTPANNSTYHLNIGGTIFGDLANDNVRIGGSGIVGAGPFTVAPPSTEVVAAAAVITANACGSIKQISATANRTTDTTDTFTAPTAAYNGCCMDVVNVDTVDTITLDQNAKFFTGPGTDLALGPGKAVRVCSDGTSWYQAASVTSVASGGNIPLSGLTAAIAANSINNADYAQTWNWQLTTNDKDAFTFTENTASTATGHSSILKAATLATSTATPLRVTNLGAGDSFVVNDETGDADASPFIVKADGKVGIGTASPGVKLDINNDNTIMSAIKTGDALRVGAYGTTDNFLSMGPLRVGADVGSAIQAADVVAGTGQSLLLNPFGGNVGIGTTTPSQLLEVYGTNAYISLLSNGEGAVTSTAASANWWDNGGFNAARSRGTIAAPTAVQSGDSVLTMWGTAYDGDTWETPALMQYFVDGTPGDGDMPGRIEFQTQADGAAVNPEATTPELVIKNSGNIGVSIAAPSAKLHVSNADAADSFRVDDVAGDTSPFVIAADGNVGIGIANPDELLDIGADAEKGLSVQVSTSGDPNWNPYIQTKRSRGTMASPTAVQNGDMLLDFIISGHDGSNFRTAAMIEAVVDGAVTGGGAADMPTRLEFQVQADGAGGWLGDGASTPEMVIKSNGAVGIGTATPNAGAKLDVAGPIFLDGLNDGSTGDLFFGGGGWPYSIGVGWAGQDNTLRFNAVGTSGGTADFRNVMILDGKTNPFAFFQGSTKRLATGGDDSTPDAMLEVIKDSTSPLFMLSSAAANNGDLMIVDTNGNVGIGLTSPASKFVVASPTAEVIGAAATITANSCGTVKRISATADRTTDTTDTFTAPTASYAGCCMDVVNVDTVDTITLDSNAKFFTGPGTDVALGPGKGVRVCSDGTSWYQAGGVSSATSASNALSGITAATTDATIASGANNITWNWQLAGAEVGHTFGETAASAGGSADQYILAAKTLATSTATPFMITNLGAAASFRVNDETGDADASPFVIAADGKVGIGMTAPATALGVTGSITVTSGQLYVPAGTLTDLPITIGGDTDSGFYSPSDGVTYLVSNGTALYQFQADKFKINSATVQIQPGFGSAAAPTYAFDSDADLGWYRAAADEIGISTAGTEKIRVDASGDVGIGNTSPASRFVVSPPSSEVIAAAAVITGDACGTVKQISATANRTTNTTDTFTTPTASYNGCCMDVVNVDTVDTITLDQNARFFTGPGTDIALAPGQGVRVCSDGAAWYQAGGVSSASAGTTAISGLTAAAAANSINNADYAQTWNWQLTTADKDAFTFTENTASTATGHSSVLKAATLATSTATPFIVTNLGAANSFVVNDETGDADTSPFIVKADGKVGVGITAPETELHLLNPTSFTTLTIGNPNVIGNNVSDAYIKLYGENAGAVYTGTISMQSMNLFLNAPNSVTTQARSTVIRGNTAGNAVLDTLILMAEDTDSAASNGIGSSIVFNLEGSVNDTYRDAAKIEGVFDDVTDNSKDGSLRFYTMGPNAVSGTTTTTERVRINSSGSVGIGITDPASRFVVASPTAEVVGAAATITANSCGTVKQISATANRTTNTTDTFTTPTASYNGCCMDVVNVDTVDTITLDQNGNFFTGAGTNIALGPGQGVRVCSDGTDWYQAGGVSSAAAGSTALSGVAAAAGDATIANAANNIVWNWQLAGAETGMVFGETAASAGGTTGASGDQFIAKASTLATSTATPFIVTNLGAANSFRVNDETGDTDATPFVIAADGKVGVGTSSPSQLLEVYGTTASISLLSNGEGAVTSSVAAANWWENGGFNASRSRGTIAAPTVVQSGDSVLTMWGTAYDGNSWETPALIQYFVDGTPGNGDMPGRIEFQTQADGAAVNPEATTPEMVIKSTGFVGIGIAAPEHLLSLGSDSEKGMGFKMGSANGYENPYIMTERSRGTNASPTVVASGDVIHEFIFNAHDGTNYEEAAYIGVYVDGTPGNDDMPGRIEFNTQPDGSSAWMGDGATTPEMVIKSTGFVGIGMSNPSVSLDVTGDIEYTGTIADVSDIRLKTNIHPLSERGSMLEKLGLVNTYSFTMKDDKEGRVEFGVMAQEIEKIFPELVTTADDEMGTKAVNYSGLIAPMIEAGKELEAQNKAMKAEIDTLKARQDEMKQAMNDITEDMKGLKVHTGYGIGKAEMSLLMILAALGTLGAVGLARRRFGQPRQ